MTRKTNVTARKQPKQERSRTTVEAILQATSRVLAREGYPATTTTRVAEVAGVSIGSLYQYFPSRESLIAQLVDEHIAKILQLLGEGITALAGEPLPRGVHTLVRTVLLVHAVDPELHAVLTQHLPLVKGFEKVRQLNLEAQAMVLAYLERHRAELRPKDLELAAFMLVTSVQAVVSAAVAARRRVDDSKLADELAALVLGFLRP